MFKRIGTISGTPSAAGTATVQVTAKDASGKARTDEFTVTIEASSTPVDAKPTAARTATNSGTSTNDASIDDIVIYHSNGTANTADDYVLIVLEDNADISKVGNTRFDII